MEMRRSDKGQKGIRRGTRVVKVGGVGIGGKNPIRIQSMTKTDTRDTKKTVSQIRELEKAGCEIIRVAVKDNLAAAAIKAIKKKIHIPLVADIHFDWRLALQSIKMGADKIRINPGNISKPAELKEIINAAKNRKIPIRIGINSGSIRTKDNRPRTGSAYTKPIPDLCRRNETRDDSFVRTAFRYIKLFEKEKFRDIIISLKSSNVEDTVRAYRKLAALCSYPFHLGITAAGPYDTGIIKSSIGIGALLLDGIGDTIRVSLTDEPLSEVIAAKRILQALQLRNFGPNIISCPTCGRCQTDLFGIVNKLERKLSAKKPITIAVMGCEVNGPGEAREADIGVAFGKNTGILFKKGKFIKKIEEKDVIKELVSLLFREGKNKGVDKGAICAGHKH